MLQINLLPHRELRRAARRRDFYVMAGLSLGAALVIVFLVAVVISGYISVQQERNRFIEGENSKLDEQIKEIAQLKSDIDSLKARQQAVEDLQSDRNLPVHLLDELVKQVPEGIYLTSVRQQGLTVALAGVAQSNDRISEMLRNLSNNSQWLNAPELLEIHSSTMGADKRRVFAFTMNVTLKRPAPGADATLPPSTPPAPAAKPAAAT
jgi:type IV pilus assembly protein PilN